LNIVGISAYFHDSACCILKDGDLIAASEEERFTLRKHDGSLPVNSFKYCLAEANLTITDIDCIAYYEVPQKKLGRQLWASLPDLPKATRQALFRFDAMRVKRDFNEILGFDGRIEFVGHHLSHAASAFYFSGFDEASILTVDGVGEWATTTYGRGMRDDIDIFEEVHFPHSIGLLYSTLTSFLGFDVNDAEYKVMGLAPYGVPRFVKQMRQLISDLPDGQFALDMDYFAFLKGERMYSDKLAELLLCQPRLPESNIEGHHKDIACSLQVIVEEMLLKKLRYLHEKVPSDNLCMAGGVALNCSANGRIEREGPFKRLFVQPAASDAGGAIGAAAIAHRRLSGKRPRVRELEHVYLGPSYSYESICSLIRAAEIEAIDCYGRTEKLIEKTAELLASGKVVGWFQGRMEFGPRALGNRSILADPRDSTMREKINAKVKMREQFRPFAPAVLEEYASNYFSLNGQARFMLTTCQVTSPFPLPAITHVDGSARLQIVSYSGNRLFSELLSAFNRLTGCPLLLNTSFNLRGEPIVLTPFDAFSCFIRSNIDILVLGDFIISRDVIRPFMLEMAKEHAAGLPKSRSISEIAYTFI
jgi:carbamoyltransferase